MPVLIGVWFGIAGSLAVLAGLTARLRVRRLRREGVAVWATAVPTPEPATPGPATPGPAGPVRLEYTLADGRVMQRLGAARGRRLRAGQKVLVWYDPADPGEVVVYGQEGRLSDRVFMLAGALFIVVGVGLAAFAP